MQELADESQPEEIIEQESRCFPVSQVGDKGGQKREINDEGKLEERAPELWYKFLS